MKYDDLIQELNTWEYDEKIFREYYFMEKTSGNISGFAARHSDHKKEVEWAQNPKKVNVHSREDTFIPQGYNVSLVKHPRYFPLFYHEHDFFEIIYVLSGTCTNSFRDSTEKLTAGDLCLIAPDVRHGILAVEDDSVILNILIRRSTFMDIFYNTVRDKTQISGFFVGKPIFQRKNTLPSFPYEERYSYPQLHSGHVQGTENQRQFFRQDHLQHPYIVFCGADQTPRKKCKHTG